MTQDTSKNQTQHALVEGERFVTAWLNIDKFPGGMMVSSSSGRFGPVPAMTGCSITTSATMVEEWREKGMPVIEVQLRSAHETTVAHVHEWICQPRRVSNVTITSICKCGAGLVLPERTPYVDLMYPVKNNAQKASVSHRFCTRCGGELVDGVCPACSQNGSVKP